jgi:GNAT superfamily N-acetyltransferase
MSRQWSVRLYRKDDEQGILELMNLNGIKRKIEEWSWEYQENPFGHLIGVAEHRGQIVGHMALVPVCIKTGLKSIKGCQAVDLIVHPKFRGQGIFLAIGKFLMNEAGKQGISLAYGFPNKPAHSGHLKYGWFDVCQVPLMIKPVNARALANIRIADLLVEHRIIGFLNRFGISRRIMNSVLSAGLATISSFNKAFNQTELDNTEIVEIRRTESFDNRIDDFWSDVSKDYMNIVVRDKKYLNWRYAEKPNANYTTLFAEEDGKIRGYVIFRSENTKNIKCGYVVDILAFLERKSTIQLLISKVVEELRRENVDLIFCWMLNSSRSGRVYYRILKANGFVSRPGNPLIARANSPDLQSEFVSNPADWYVTMGDSDNV